MLLALAELNGDVTVLDKAAEILVDAPKSVQDALAQCREMATMMAIRLPKVPVHIDLAELRGYHYHTSLVFAAYRSGMSQTIAVGGRYDDIGGVFGHAQPATGFSLDLKNVVSFARDTTSHAVISTTWSNEPDQLAVIAELRAAGESVRYQLPNATDKATRQLLKQDGRWVVVGE
jgi:ATP phosphoribosyltransferase regulatory subunit